MRLDAHEAWGLMLMKLGAWSLKLGPGARAAIDIDPPSLVKQLSANDLVLFPKEFCLMFTICYILNIMIPARSACLTLAALIWGRASSA